MSRYRRSKVAGATYFFTVGLADRSSSLLIENIERLRHAYGAVQRKQPFSTSAICILPDHLHAIWELPPEDAEFSLRWSQIKTRFSRSLPAATARSASKVAKREKGIWQRRFWEHRIRDELDLRQHIDYIHYNPVKHGLVTKAADWPYSSYHRYVERGLLPNDWAGTTADIAVLFGERD